VPSGAVFEMEKLLLLWVEGNVLQIVPLNLLMFQVKARSLFEDLKVNISDPEAKFVAANL
jgi:hypothetical protein